MPTCARGRRNVFMEMFEMYVKKWGGARHVNRRRRKDRGRTLSRSWDLLRSRPLLPQRRYARLPMNLTASFFVLLPTDVSVTRRVTCEPTAAADLTVTWAVMR
jgi:hypothetical protein